MWKINSFCIILRIVEGRTSLYIVLVCQICESKPASTGLPTTTKGDGIPTRNFKYFQRISEPCGVTNDLPDSSVVLPASPKETYQIVSNAAKKIQHQLYIVGTTNPNTQCFGMKVKSLPVTKPMTNLNLNGTMIQSYKSGLYLASFLHQMVFDRELQPALNDNQNDTESNLGKNLPLNPPAETLRRCGNETGSYLKALEAVAKGFEGLLCSLSNAATAEQKEAFKELTNKLGSTFIYKFMWCPSLEIRDCLVIKEANKASKFISKKFEEFGKETQGGDGLEDEDVENQEDDNNKMDNNL